MEYEMKAQPRPALTVKRSEHVAAPGRERPFLLSLLLYYISAGLPTLEWAQKPRRRVTHDKCPGVSPTGPAWPCHSICPTGPRGVLAGVSFGHRALESARFPKRLQRFQCLLKSTLPGPGGGGELQPRVLTNLKWLSGVGRGTGKARLPLSSTPIDPSPKTQLSPSPRHQGWSQNPP